MADPIEERGHENLVKEGAGGERITRTPKRLLDALVREAEKVVFPKIRGGDVSQMRHSALKPGLPGFP